MNLTSRIGNHLDDLSRYYKGVYYYIITRGGDKTYADSNEIRELLKVDELQKDLIVCNERLDKCVSISNGAKICRATISGANVFLEIDEGMKINVGDVAAHVITKKGEVRKVRSNCKGYVVLIYELIGKPQTYEVYVVGEEYVREFKP